MKILRTFAAFLLRSMYFSSFILHPSSLFFVVVISSFILHPSSFASTGCNFPTSHDSWADKGAGDSITVADVNQFRCAIEQLERILRALKGTAGAPAYSFINDTDTGMDSSGANILDWSIAGVFQWRMDGTAYFPVADNSEDLGKAANRIRDLYMAGAFKAGLDATLGTITTNDPILNATVTWNAAGVTFEGIKLNVTDTASAAASSLIDLQVGGASMFKVDKTGAVTSTNLMRPPNKRRWSYFAPSGAGSTVIGDAETVTGTATNSGGVSTPYRQYATSATNGSDAGISGELIYRRQNNTTQQFRGAISATSAIRAWIGLTDASLTQMTGVDSTTGFHVAAFRYSTVAGDGNWKACTSSAGGSTCTDTGVAAVTSETEFEIQINDGVPNVVFKINDSTVATNTANLPSPTQDLRAIAGVETQEAVAKNTRMNWMYIEGDK